MNRNIVALCATLSLCVLVAPSQAQTLGAEFTAAYSLVDLGSPTGVPSNYGGLVLKAGDPNTLLLGGAANGGGGNINQVSLTRTLINGQNRISGFTGTATVLSTAPNIDGGLVYAPNGVLLYAGFPNNVLGQIKPGSITPDRIDTLTGVVSSVGTLQFIPQGFGSNSGKLMIASYNGGGVYTADLVADGNGTYNIANLSGSLFNLGTSQPEGIVYVPGGSPLFSAPSMLVSEYSAGQVAAYEVNALGIPIAGTRRTFISGLTGAEGATFDPSTGDFLFSTFGGGSKVITVRGFATPPVVVPEAGSGLLVLLPILATGAAVIVRRRKA